MAPATSLRTRRRQRVRQVCELLIRPRRSRRTVAFQWHDGAGELHYQELSPAQSWPYLQQR